MHYRFLTGLLALAVMATACGGAPSTPPAVTAGARTSISVNVAPVSRATISQTYVATGDVKALSEVNVVPKQNGRIDQLAVGVGSVVKVGDVIAQLEHTTLDLNLANAQALLAGSQAKLATVKAGPRAETVKQAEINVSTAQSRLQTVLDPRAENVKQAEINVSSAQSRLQTVLDGPRPAAVAQAAAGVDAAKQKLAAVLAGGKASSVQQAQALLTSAQARLQALKNGPRPVDLAPLQVAVEQAKSGLYAAQVSRDGACNPRNPAYLCNAANASVSAADNGVAQAEAALRARVAPATSTDLQQAQSAVDQAQAALDAAQKPFTDQDVKQAQDAVAQAQASLALASQPYTSEDAQQARNAVAQAQVSLALASQPSTSEDVQQARNAVDTAIAQLQLAKSPFTPEDVQSADAAVAQAQVGVDQARQNIKDATVTSPVDGVITQKLLDVGSLASTASPLVTIDSLTLKITVPVEETQVTDLKVGQSASISGAVLGSTLVSGKVTSVAPTGDKNARKFTADIAPEPSDSLLPGMFVKVAIDVQKHSDVLAVPSTALITRADKTFVFVVQDGVARQTTVEVGLANATLTEVTKGLSEGSSVVVQGLEGLNDGDRVTILGGAAG